MFKTPGSKSTRAGRYGKRPRLQKIEPDAFKHARIFAGMDRETAAEFLGVSVRTVGHWETGKARPSYAAFKLLRAYRHGDLLHPAWAGCRVNHRGALVTPEDREIYPHDLAWLSLLVRRAAHMGTAIGERDRLRSILAGSPDPVRKDGGRADVCQPGQGAVVSKAHTSRPLAAGHPTPATAWWLLPSSKRGVSETEQNPGVSQKSLVFKPFQAGCALTFMGPKWGHEKAAYTQVQPEGSGADVRASAGNGGHGWAEPERVAVHGHQGKDPVSVDPPASAQASGSAGSRSACTNPGTSASTSTSASAEGCARVRAARRQGRTQRTVPVRKRAQGESLPSGKLLTGGEA